MGSQMDTSSVLSSYDSEGLDSSPESINQPVDDEKEGDTRKPATFNTGLSKFYVHDWTAKEAFRELYQNWRDALIQSFGLDPRSFSPSWKDLKGEIQITVREPHATPDKGQLLGYIKFHKNTGRLDLVNFNARLTPDDFSLGVSTKRGSESTAGHHGEGFKLAALSLHRLNHCVRICASSYTWNFYFGGTNRSSLYVRQRPVKQGKIEKAQVAYATRMTAGKPRYLRANAWEDVSVEIRKRPGGKRIETEEFLSWVSVALDLKGPTSHNLIVKTDRGDLILDEAFAGCLYLKGLLLSDTNNTSRPFRFGYNFVEGKVDRDRRQMKDSSEEANILASIWEHAIQHGGKQELESLIDIFQKYPFHRDIREAQDKFTYSAARAIWAHLVSSKEGIFYYNEKTGEKDVELILKFLKKQPFMLSQTLWRLLRRFNLARTPVEQRAHLFRGSPESEFIPDVFSISVHRALLASLTLDSRMRNIRVSYVKSSHIDIDFLFTAQESLLQINEKWLDFQRIHETAICHISSTISESALLSKAFVCDHIVDNLLELVMLDIICSLNLTKDESMSLVRKLHHAARDLLQQMPRRIEVMQSVARQLQISWTDCDPGLILYEYRRNIEYSVHLHRKSTCSLYGTFFRGSYSRMPDVPQPFKLPCDCPFQIISGGLTKAVFKDLDSKEEYLPAVSRASAKAFIAIPPQTARLKTLPAHGCVSEIPNRESDGNFPGPSQANGVPLPAGGRSQTPGTICPSRENKRGGASPSLLEDGEQDDNAWRQWRAQELPNILSNFTSTRESRARIESSISSLHCSDLLVTFKAGEYYQVRIKPKDGANGNHLEYIIFLHDFDFDEEAAGINQYRLVVSKYSFFKSSTLFNPCLNKTEAVKSIGDRELLLHFQDFWTMGQRQDAEIMRISDISYAKDVETNITSSADTVEHISHLSEDAYVYNLYCRFAIYASQDSETSCLTPVGSNLLPHRDRWKTPSYNYLCSPAVFDMSPHILGPSEGFSQGSCNIYAALDFNPSNGATWKVRYPESLVYDGFPGSVLGDFSTSRLVSPEFPGTSIPKVALISCCSTPFLFGATPNDPEDAPKLPLTRALETLKAITASTAPWPGRFDFITLLMPSAILHGDFYTLLLNSILDLLTRKYSVHLKLVHFADYTMPQARDALILLASPVCTAAPWPEKVDSLQTAYDHIRDLVSKNPRSTEGSNDSPGFVSKYSISSSSQTTTFQHSLYNHQSATLFGRDLPIDLNTREADIFGLKSPRTLHPDRHDNITIRELARLQGFPDDFVFFGSLAEQTESIYQAFPPPIAKLVAETIVRIVRKCQVAPVVSPSKPCTAPRGYKRPRVDDADDEDDQS